MKVSSSRETIDPALLRFRPGMIYVEMTSRCNARCVYCPVSHPEYQGSDLEMDIETLADVLVNCHPSEVQFSGHGETTMLKGWAQAARVLFARGLPMTLTSNFLKRFSDDEIDVLTRFRALKISVDSADPELQFKLRRGVKLEQVEENLARVIKACEEACRDLPFLHISCTITDVCMPGIPDLVRWSAQNKAHALALVNLVRHPDPPGAIPIRHPVEVDPEGARDSVRRAREAARELNIRFDMEPGLIDALGLESCR